jgi:hypothetical protein
MENLPLHPSHLKSSESFRTSKPQKLPKSKKTSKESSFLQTRGEVRLTDLCPEDKARIGELVKRLALEKSQREETESRFEHEKEFKEKQLKRLAKENERIRAETREIQAKYEKSLEILETYKINEQMKNSWKEWDPPAGSRGESQVLNSMRITPEPNALSHIPLSPIRDVMSVGVQTVCDKEIQTADEGQNQTLKVAEFPQSDAIKNIKILKDDIFSLSESVRNCNLTSLRASQNLIHRKEVSQSSKFSEYPKVEEERIKKLIERSEASTKRGNILRENQKSDDFILEKTSSIGYFEQSFNGNQSPPPKHQFSFKKESSLDSSKEISAGFYDENLFNLVDDLEKMESQNFEDSEARFSDFSDLSRKESLDSLEELRSRALRLKNTLKY